MSNSPRAFRYWKVSCSALQCLAVFCSVLQCAAMCCSVLQCFAVCCSVLQCVAVCCSVLKYVLQNFALCCSLLPSQTLPCQHTFSKSCVLQYVVVCAACCSVLQCLAACCISTSGCENIARSYDFYLHHETTQIWKAKTPLLMTTPRQHAIWRLRYVTRALYLWDHSSH